MKKFYAVTNPIVVILTIIWNYSLNSGIIYDKTVSEVSEKYETLITPASYAFSIWGLIYLGLLALSAFMIKRVFFSQKEDNFVMQVGPWLIIANISSMIWMYFWLNENLVLSVIFMLLILFSLILVVVRTSMEKWDAPLPIIAWLWWPVDLYTGWIAIASIANIASCIKAFSGGVIFSNEVQWTLIMIIIATIINLLMIIFRNMREFAAVGIWAIIAIAVRHWGEIPSIQWTALISSAILLVVILIHGYQNRETNPLNTLFRRAGMGL